MLIVLELVVIPLATSVPSALNKPQKNLIGQRTLLDLLNTENELFEARKDYLDAKYSEQYAKYRLMNATGNLLSALRVDVPEEWMTKVEY